MIRMGKIHKMKEMKIMKEMKKLKRDDENNFPASAEIHTPSRRDDTLLTVCFSLRAE
jgi:hypothetical protein